MTLTDDRPAVSPAPAPAATATAPVLRFKRYATVTPVPGDGVYLTSERGDRTRLAGAGVELLAPHLIAGADRATLRADLEQRLPGAGAKVDLVVDRLVAAGHVVETAPGTDARQAGYWELAGLDGDTAARRVATAVVGWTALGDVDPAPLLAAAAGQGLHLTPAADLDQPADLHLVLTDDYRRDGVRAFNRTMLDRGTPWLLSKPWGSVVWIGPIFVPGETACAECLLVRLRQRSMTESYLRQRGAVRGAFVESTADLPVTRTLAAQLTVLQAVRFLTGLTDRPLREPAGIPTADAGPHDAEVVTLDTFTLQTVSHPLLRRPQCPACGDPQIQTRRQQEPVRLTRRPKAVSADGGHRALPPEQFVAAYEKFVSPVTGPVSHLRKLPLDLPGIHTYTAGQNFAMPMRGVADLRAGLRSASCGKGISDIQAKASALGEAIERYSCVFHGDEPRTVARAADLNPADVIAPNDVHLFSDAQFRDRAAWNSRPSHFHWVGERLDPQQPVEWSPLWSLTEQRAKLAPTAMLYFSYHSADHPFQAGANSNGCAAGSTLEDAILQGFFELVERDATALWWYNRVRRPAVDLDSFDDPYFRHWQRTYRAQHRETWVLDLTSDLGIPTVAAVSYRTDKPVQDILFALGSHFDLRIAVGRALSEMNQFLPAVVHVDRNGDGYAFDDPAQLDWWRTATLAEHPYLLPSADAPTTATTHPDRSSDDLAQDVRTAEKLVADAGLEMLVLDHTRVDIGLPVARVIVPGLRHFWPRYAPGRLYDVPVRLGWLPEPTAEADLNPVAMFL